MLEPKPTDPIEGGAKKPDDPAAKTDPTDQTKKDEGEGSKDEK